MYEVEIQNTIVVGNFVSVKVLENPEASNQVPGNPGFT
jgi:hypothetical protein